MATRAVKRNPATPAVKRVKRKTPVKKKTVTVTFQLPESEIQEALAESLLELADRRYRSDAKKTVTIS